MHIDKIPADIRWRICYHRGIGGPENTVPALANAIARKPFLVEFDIQWVKGRFVLGHPPEVTNYTLQQALTAYKNTGVMPKIDLKVNPKLDEQKETQMLEQLINILLDKTYASITTFLINVSAETSGADCIRIESKLDKLVTSRVKLNVDLWRYSDTSTDDVLKHVKSLANAFSISPEVYGGDLKLVLKTAKAANIEHVHFWIHPFLHASVSLWRLRKLLKWAKKHDLTIYFDIAPAKVVSTWSWLWHRLRH